MLTRTARIEPDDAASAPRDGAARDEAPHDDSRDDGMEPAHPAERRVLTTEDVRAMADEALRELCGELPRATRAHTFTPDPVVSAVLSDANVAVARMPRLTASIGRTFVAAFTVGLTAQFGAGLVAAAGGAGVVFVAARAALHNGMDTAAAVMAFAAFVVVAAVWCPAALALASRAAWRAALRDPGVARAMAEGIAAALLPAQGDATGPGRSGDPPDPSLSGAADASGLGLYPLADRVRGALEQALTDTIRIRWIRRFVASVAAGNTDRVMAKHLESVGGPTGDAAVRDRNEVRLALANAVEAALVGRD